MKKIAIYARVSTEEQAAVEEGSIKNQIQSLAKYVEVQNQFQPNWGSVVEVYKDEGFSAKNLNRPDVKRLINDIHTGKIDTVIITEISRLSRSVKDWIHLREFFEKKKASFISIRQKFDTSDAMGRAMLNFAIEFSQLEREMTAERVKASYQARASRGLWTGGIIPFGLDRTDRNGYLVVNSAKQIIVEKMFDIILNQAGSIAGTVTEMNKCGYRREDGSEWNEKALATWVRRRELIGEIEINAKNKSEQQSNLAENERYKVVPAAWEAVISKEKWVQANELLDQNYHSLKVSQWKHFDYLLRGIITCAQGKYLAGSSGFGRSGQKYPSYKHSPKDAGCLCGIKSVPAPTAHELVFKEIKSLINDPNILKGMVKEANDRFKGSIRDVSKDIFATKTRVNSLNKKIDKITDDLYGDHSITDSEKKALREQLQRCQKQKEGAEVELAELQSKTDVGQAGMIDIQALVKAVELFVEKFDGLPVAARRNLLSSIVDEVVVDGKEATVKIKNPGFFKDNLKSDSVNLGGHLLAQGEEWLLGRSIIRTNASRSASD